MDMSSIISSRKYEEAVAIEKVHFVKTDRVVDPRKVSPFKYLKGNIPVLIAASHAVRHIRKKKIKPSDLHTGSLAYLLNTITGCHSLVLTKLYGGDPNYDKKCIFKRELKKICQTYGIKLVLDLHGASGKREFDIDLGTMNGRSLLGKIEFKNELERQLKKCGIKRVSFNYFPAERQNTITKYAAQELKVPAIQLEINRKYRAPDRNGVSYNRLLAALSAFILGVNKKNE